MHSSFSLEQKAGSHTERYLDLELNLQVVTRQNSTHPCACASRFGTEVQPGRRILRSGRYIPVFVSGNERLRDRRRYSAMRALRTGRSSLLIVLVLATSLGGVELVINTQATIHPAMLFPGSTAMGSTSAYRLVPVEIIARGVTYFLTAVAKGTSTGDYVIDPGGTCGQQVAYVAGQRCTVSLSFKPQRAGLRQGAVLIRADDGTLLGSTLVTGIGLGSVRVSSYGNITTVAGNGASLYCGNGFADLND